MLTSGNFVELSISTSEIHTGNYRSIVLTNYIFFFVNVSPTSDQLDQMLLTANKHSTAFKRSPGTSLVIANAVLS